MGIEQLQAHWLLTNQCALCSTTLSSTIGTVHHVQSMFKAGRCAVDRTRMKYRIEEREYLGCPACKVTFADVRALQMHIRGHVESELVLEFEPPKLHTEGCTKELAKWYKNQ